MSERRKSMIGRVVSDKMDKTVVVAVETRKRHPMYGKVVRSVKRYKAHDENNASHSGDLVRIQETRPLSKEKRWIVTDVLEQAR
jgi:small subunit ribosomal protein S17